MSIQSILSIIFAFLGLIFGALFAIFTQNKMEKYAEYAESLASGFMLAVVFFDLIPNAVEKAKFLTVFLGICAGIAVILLISKISLGKVLPKTPSFGLADKSKENLSNNFDNAVAIDSKGTKASTTSSVKIFRNLTTAFAVALHNIPEGIALGALDGQEILISTAILIAVHNIPEGMAMSFPLAKIDIKWYKILFFAFVTGACTVLGWGIGILVAGISDEFIGFLLAISSGAMLQIVFGEMMEESKSKNSGNLTLIGILIGMIIATLV